METQRFAPTLDLVADSASPPGDCPICGGDGFLIGDDGAEVQCEACDGSGQLQPGHQAA